MVKARSQTSESEALLEALKLWPQLFVPIAYEGLQRLVSVGRRGRVPSHEQSIGNIDEAEGSA